MLGEKIQRYHVNVWLVNTGWTRGAYGTGKRIKLAYTRAMVAAALSGSLSLSAYQAHPVFGIQMPKTCAGVPAEILNPRNTWANKEAYDKKAKELAMLFIKNFDKYASGVNKEILNAAPKAD